MPDNAAHNGSKPLTSLTSRVNHAPTPESPVPFDEAPGEYLTRRQAAGFIRTVLGRPFSFSTATKLSALGEFAPPAVWWGRRPLYTREGLRAWVAARESHIRPERREAHWKTPQARPATSRKLSV